jgi:hypothetical protein
MRRPKAKGAKSRKHLKTAAMQPSKKRLKLLAAPPPSKTIVILLVQTAN